MIRPRVAARTCYALVALGLLALMPTWALAEQAYTLAKTWNVPPGGHTDVVHGIGAGNSADTVYLAHCGPPAIYKFSTSGALLSQWGASGLGQISAGSDIAVGPNGHVFASDYGRYSIVEFTATGTFVRRYATGQQCWGVAVDAAGFLYAAENAAHRVVKYNPNGSISKIFAVTTSSETSYVAVDQAGNVYLTQTAAGKITKFNPAGDIAKEWTTGTNYLQGIAVDSAGDILVVDNKAARVLKYDNEGTAIPVSFGVTFTKPMDVAVDANGMVYVCEYDSRKVYRFALSPGNTLPVVPPVHVPVLERLGRWDGAAFQQDVTAGSLTSGKIHVLVHGWQPGYLDWVKSFADPEQAKVWNAPPIDGVSPADSLRALAASIRQVDPTAIVLAYSWIDDAATVGLPWGLPKARESRVKADGNGLRLREVLYKACDMAAGNDPQLHLIGHSHGARVAAIAANDLQQLNHPVEHLTIMDSPDRTFVLGARNNLDMELAKLTYGRTEGTTFIENYRSSLLGAAYHDLFGDVVNVELTPADGDAHGYPMLWYTKANNSQAPDIGLHWSPLYGTRYQGLDSSYVQDWDLPLGLKDLLRELMLRSESGSIGPDYRKLYPLGYVSMALNGDVVRNATGAVLTEHSPASWDLLFTKDVGTSVLQFNYQFLGCGDGDELGVWIDGQLRFVVTGDMAGDTQRTAAIAIDDVSLGEHVITVALHSRGQANASVSVGDFMAVSSSEPVVSTRIDRDWVYQNTAATTSDRHRFMLTIFVDSDPAAPQDYAVTVTEPTGAVICQATADPMVWEVIGGRRGLAPAGTVALNIAVTGVASRRTAETQVGITVRRLGDIDGAGGVNGQDKLLLNNRLNGLLPNSLEFDLDCVGGTNSQDKLILNKILCGLAIP